MTVPAVLHHDDLAPLVGLLDLLAEHQRAIGAYAAAWVCRPDGFAPSPVCLLQPLGAALGPLREQVEAVSAELVVAWQGLADGVRGAVAEIDRADDAVAGVLGGLAGLAGSRA